MCYFRVTNVQHGKNRFPPTNTTVIQIKQLNVHTIYKKNYIYKIKN